jgi:capsular polysaccharide biosynthesis protein
MELQDYWLALRRHWPTWLGVTLAGLLVALGIVLVTPPTYQATAQVFVASVDDSTSGSQFVNQRVTSYPQVADSQTVLGPVIAELGLTVSFSDLRKQVSATNPVDTSQIEIAVTDRDPDTAAEIANAVAERFGTAVEVLEQPGTGPSPVSLTVTNPATVPTSPISPVPTLLLPLGLIVGLVLGAAAAIVRSRLDTRLHSADDVRAAWGPGAEQLVVHAPLPGRRRNSSLTHGPTTLLARQLEPMAEGGLVRVLVLSPSPGPRPAAQTVVDRVAAELTAWEVPVEVLAPPQDGVPDRGSDREPVQEPGQDAGRTGVQLGLGSPLASLREWRRITRWHAGVVLVVEPGRIDRADLQETRSILDAAGVPVLAVVLPLAERRRLRRRTARRAPSEVPASEVQAGAPTSDEPAVTEPAPAVPALAGRAPGAARGRRGRTTDVDDGVPAARR